MRLSCSFKCDKFPVTYQMLGVSLIKQSLEQADSEYFDRLYKYEDKSNKKSKNFCFSVFVKDYEIQDDTFVVNGDVIINFSTPDLEFGINLYNGLLKIKEFEYKEFKLIKQKIFLLKDKHINNQEVTLKTLSPVFVKDKNNQHIMPWDEGFTSELNYILDLELENYRGYGLQAPIQFETSKGLIKKKVVKEELREFKELTNKNTYYTNAFSGVFKLSGNIQDLQDIYMLGIGFRRGQGFGMVEVV